MFCILKAYLSNDVLLDYVLSNWNSSISGSFGYGHLSASEQEDVTKKINSFYFGRGTTPTNGVDRQHLTDVSAQK